MKQQTLRIDPEFKAQIPPLTEDERKQTLADMYRVFRILFPNWRDIAKKLRDDTGRVPRGAITSFILETIAALSPNS